MYWFYWEDNGQTPKIVLNIIRLIKKNLTNYRIVNNKTIHKYIEVVDTSNLEHIAQKVDYYRAKLLYTYGGIWLDMDTIILDKIDYLYEELQNSEKEVMISTSELADSPPNVCLGYLISKPKSTIFKLWYESMEAVILNNPRIPYLFFGHELASIINRHGLATTILPFPNNITFRFGGNNYQKYYRTEPKFIESTIDEIKRDKHKLIILYGGQGMYNYKITSKSMLFAMFKHAISK
jgi:mannosyltransferase OCH1-like enzyme